MLLALAPEDFGPGFERYIITQSAFIELQNIIGGPHNLSQVLGKKPRSNHKATSEFILYSH